MELRRYFVYAKQNVRLVSQPEVITDQCSAFDLIRKIEVLAAGMEVDFIFT